MLVQAALLILGLALLVTGVALFSIPAALIVGGAVLAACAVLVDPERVKRG